VPDAVAVVDDLILEQSATEDVRHDNAMFEDVTFACAFGCSGSQTRT
jgi:hypothetical protein